VERRRKERETKETKRERARPNGLVVEKRLFFWLKILFFFDVSN